MQTIEEMLNTAQYYYESGQIEEAYNIYYNIIQSQSNNPIALHSLGLIEYQKGDIHSAIEYINKAILSDDTYTSAYYNLGIILENIGDLNNAIVQYENASLTSLNYLDAYLSLARVLQKIGDLNKAIDQYKKVLEFDPNHEFSLISLGNILNNQEKTDEALIYYQKAKQLNPYNLSTLNNLGVVLRKQGQIKEAISVFRQIVSQVPSSGAAYFNLVQIEPFLEDMEIKTIHQLLGQSNLSYDDRIYLHLSLGLVYNKSKSYDQAFFHTKSGNDLQRKKINYSTKNESLLFNSIKEIFNKEYFKKRFTTNENESESPVFIIGMPRSGSTLIEQIISTHPLAYGAGETVLLDNILAKAIKKDSIFESLASLDKHTINHLAKEYMDQLHLLCSGKKIFTNKKLDNYLYLGIIALMFPNAKIIHAKRDPMDNCLSCYMTWFHTGQYFSYDLKELGEYYQIYMDLMEYWKQTLPIKILEVQYEDLIEKPEETSKQIISYCDLEWDEKCLSFHKNKRSVQTASDLQVTKPIYKSSMKRWKPYEKHLLPLKEVLNMI